MAGKLRKIASPSAAACLIDSIHHRGKGSEENRTGVGTMYIGTPLKSNVYLQAHVRILEPRHFPFTAPTPGDCLPEEEKRGVPGPPSPI